MYKLGGMNMSYAIEVNNLVKTYDDIEAVKNISFFVEKDTFFAFLGPNGAGKSTTINIIATLLEKNQGTIKVLGHEVGKADNKIREKIGVVFQASMLDKLLTVKENLLDRVYIKESFDKDIFKMLELKEDLK